MDENIDPLTAALETIIAQLDEQTAEGIKNASDDDCGMMHFGLGMWIRNNFGLWTGSPLHDFLSEKGFAHEDDMSGAVILALRARLQGKDPMEAIKK